MWYIIVGAGILSVILLKYLIRFFLSSLEWGGGQTFICPECGREFDVSGLKVFITGYRITEGGVNDRNKRIQKCPHCGKKSLCVMKDHRL